MNIITDGDDSGNGGIFAVCANFLFRSFQVLFFAKSRELVGCSQAALSTPAHTTARDLLDAIVLAHPQWVQEKINIGSILVFSQKLQSVDVMFMNFQSRIIENEWQILISQIPSKLLFHFNTRHLF